MSGGRPVFDHQFGEYAFEMFRDSSDFGGEDDGDLGVTFALA
jgi:hypothetical protein